MSKTTWCAALLVVACLLPAYAQERRQGGSSNGLPPYDVAKETVVSGIVGKTESAPTMDGSSLLMLTIAVDGQPLHLILAPAGFVKQQSFTFTADAKVEATGMPGLRYQGEPAMIARTLKIGTRTLTLRDAKGKPAWEGPGQR